MFEFVMDVGESGGGVMVRLADGVGENGKEKKGIS